MTLEEAIEHIEKVNNLSIEDRKDKTILLTSLSLRLGIVEYLIETKKFQDEDMSKADKVGDYIIKLGNELKEIKNEK